MLKPDGEKVYVECKVTDDGNVEYKIVEEEK